MELVMPDEPRPPMDDDDEYNAWRAARRAAHADEVAPSVTFMAMMRSAALTASAEESSGPEPATPDSMEAQLDALTTQLVASSAFVSVPETQMVPSPPDEPPSLPDRPHQRPNRPRSVPDRRGRGGVLGGCLTSLIIVLAAAGLSSTIFTWATPNDFIANNVRRGLSAAIATEAATPQPTAQPTPNWERRIGVVAGHRGPENDPGAVCPDGLTEASITLNVAERVVRGLQGRGYTVDLLDEFDPRLNNYRVDALVSIHANTCQDFGEPVSGFLIAAAAARISARGNDDVLVECIARNYAMLTQLERRQGLTVDMTDYHTFREIHPLTPAAILELGFMLGDRELLTEQPDLMAQAITEGVVCFLNPEILN